MSKLRPRGARQLSSRSSSAAGDSRGGLPVLHVEMPMIQSHIVPFGAYRAPLDALMQRLAPLGAHRPAAARPALQRAGPEAPTIRRSCRTRASGMKPCARGAPSRALSPWEVAAHMPLEASCGPTRAAVFFSGRRRGPFGRAEAFWEGRLARQGEAAIQLGCQRGRGWPRPRGRLSLRAGEVFGHQPQYRHRRELERGTPPIACGGWQAAGWWVWCMVLGGGGARGPALLLISIGDGAQRTPLAACAPAWRPGAPDPKCPPGPLPLCPTSDSGVRRPEPGQPGR